MNNNLQQPGQFGPPPRPQPEGLEARFHKAPAWVRWGLISLSGLIFISTAIFLMILVGASFAPDQSVAAAPTVMQQVPTVTPMATVVTVVPTPTVAPTPTPDSASVQQPGGQPSSGGSQQQAPPAQLSVSFTGVSAVDGSSSYVSVHTLPGAALTISVKYCSGSYATSGALKGTQYADGNGDHTWNWTPDTKCKGTATAYVTASLNGQSASNSTSFNVS